MRSLKLFFMTIVFGLFTVAGMAQERQGQWQQEEQQQDRQMQERSIEITDLPQPVQETLQEDYEDYRATEAFLSSDPEEGTFYKVKVQNTEDAQETKILKIATDGEVIDEEEFDETKQRRQYDQDGDRQYAPAAQERGQQERGQHQQEGQRGQQQHGQQGQLQVTDLPEDVQEKINDDYEDWRPVSVEKTSDFERHEEGTFYKVTLSKMDNGEQKHKVVNITTDGEVIDEEEIDAEEFRRQQQQRDRQYDGQQQDRQYTPAAQERGQQEGQRGQQEGQRGQQQQHGQQHMEGRSLQVTDLPQEVQETLNEDYEDWRPVSAEMTSDFERQEEGAFYKVTMSKFDNGEQKHKVVNISTDGEVIDEEEIDAEEFRRQQQQRQQHDQQRDRQYDGQQQDQQRRDGQQHDQQRDRQYDGQQGQQGQQGQYDGQQHGRQGQGHDGQFGQDQQERDQERTQEGQQHMQGRALQVTDLPQEVQETLNEDYEDWRPVDVQVTTDAEVYDEGSFYKIKMNKADNGEMETKTVKIARDGEVIDEEDGDEGFEGEDRKKKRDRRR
jgi:hypothetical protein